MITKNSETGEPKGKTEQYEEKGRDSEGRMKGNEGKR